MRRVLEEQDVTPSGGPQRAARGGRGGERRGGRGGERRDSWDEGAAAAGHAQRWPRRGRRDGAAEGEGGGAGSAPFSREAFVKANFIFCLRPGTESAAVRGSDALEWSDVLSVLVNSDAPVTCPICLDLCRAPRMTACGHVYCLVCLKRLFAHAREQWGSCPLCAAFTHERDVRRVAEIRVQPKVAAGDMVELSLVRRPHQGTVPVPVPAPALSAHAGLEPPPPPPSTEHSLSHLQHEQERSNGQERSPELPGIGTERARFARMCLDSREHLVGLARRELSELRAQGQECASLRDALGVDLVRSAAQEAAQLLAPGWAASPEALDELAAAGRGGGAQELAQEPAAAAAAAAKREASRASRRERLERQLADGGNAEAAQFYQISDGRLVFLDPFSYKCLARQLDADGAAHPATLRATVLATEQLVLTPQAVKRNPFLVHVPQPAQVSFVELDLGALVSEATRAEFHDEAAARRRRREFKQRAEQRHEKLTEQRIRRSAGDDLAAVGYAIDYREYAQRQKEIHEQVERDLAHAFDASLSGHVLSPQEEEALARSLEERQASVWTGSFTFSSVVNANGNFPALGSSPPKAPAPSRWGPGSGPPAAHQQQQQQHPPPPAWALAQSAPPASATASGGGWPASATASGGGWPAAGAGYGAASASRAAGAAQGPGTAQGPGVAQGLGSAAAAPSTVGEAGAKKKTGRKGAQLLSTAHRTYR
jgi:hypothetical protein